MSDKQIQEWQEKVRSSFGDEAKLYQYLFETMDNFYYRYLETSQNSDMKTQNFGAHLWGAKSSETSMVNALKISNPEAKKGIIELAKSVPGGKGVAVQYELLADVKELTIDQGMIRFTSTISWDFPNFSDSSKKIGKSITFKYEDLAQFRKELALKLEDVCTLFL